MTIAESPSSPTKRWKKDSTWEVLKALADATERPPEVVAAAELAAEVEVQDVDDVAKDVEGAAVAEVSLKQMNEKELASLRQVVETDDRYGKVLERCAATLPEVMPRGMAQVLAHLAGLVWQSLRLLWELEPGTETPKARLTAKVAGLEQELAQALSEQEKSRRDYFRELVVLRERLRKLDTRTIERIHEVVHEEAPVMFYEPLMYLDEITREHIADIVEEKLKLLLSKGQDGGETTLARLLARADRAERRVAELEMSEAILKERLEAREANAAAAERAVKDIKTIKRGLREVMGLVRENYAVVNEILEEKCPDVPQLHAPPLAEHLVLTDHLSYLGDFLRKGNELLFRLTNRRLRTRTWSGRPDEAEEEDEQVPSEPPPPEPQQAPQQPQQEVKQPAPVPERQVVNPNPPTVLHTGVDPAHLKKMQLREKEMNASIDDLTKDLAASEERNRRLEDEIKRLKELLEEMRQQLLDQQNNNARAFSQLPKWKTPKVNVFKRLQEDSKKRLEHEHHAQHAADVLLPSLHLADGHTGAASQLQSLLYMPPSNVTAALPVTPSAGIKKKATAEVVVPRVTTLEPLDDAGPTALALAVQGTQPLHRMDLEISEFSDPVEALHYIYSQREAELLARIEKLEATLESERQRAAEIPRIASKDPRFMASLLSVQQKQSSLSRPLGQWLDDIVEQVPKPTMERPMTSASRVRSPTSSMPAVERKVKPGGHVPLRRPRSAASLGGATR